jgi:hypothetical protein
VIDLFIPYGADVNIRSDFYSTTQKNKKCKFVTHTIGIGRSNMDYYNRMKGPRVLNPKMAGKKIKLCSHDIPKKACRICSPSLYCPCNKLISKCPKCIQHRGRCGCGKTRSTCRVHGGKSKKKKKNPPVIYSFTLHEPPTNPNIGV